MTTRPTEETLQSAPRKVRPQRYLGFTLKPGDEELLEQLPKNQKEILLAQGHYGDIAASLGIPIGTVRSRLHRARQALSALRQRDSEVSEPAAQQNDRMN